MGSSAGIGLELAMRCGKAGYDLLIASDEPEIEQAARDQVQSLQADLATTKGTDRLYAAAKGRCDRRRQRPYECPDQ